MTSQDPVIIHSRNGKLGPAPLSSVAEVVRALDSALTQNPDRGLVIHFHGGLISAASGMQIAGKLDPIYRSAKTTPIFFVWESGLIDSIRNNLSDILEDPVFRELVKKAAEWVLKQLPGLQMTRGVGSEVDESKLRREFDDWFDGKNPGPPVPDTTPPPAAVTRDAEPDEDELAAKIESELDNDPRFQEVLAGLGEASGRVVVRPRAPESPRRAISRCGWIPRRWTSYLVPRPKIRPRPRDC